MKKHSQEHTEGTHERPIEAEIIVAVEKRVQCMIEIEENHGGKGAKMKRMALVCGSIVIRKNMS